MLPPRPHANRRGIASDASYRPAQRAGFGRIDRRSATRAAIGAEQDFVIGAFSDAIACPAITANHTDSGIAGRTARTGRSGRSGRSAFPRRTGQPLNLRGGQSPLHRGIRRPQHDQHKGRDEPDQADNAECAEQPHFSCRPEFLSLRPHNRFGQFPSRCGDGLLRSRNGRTYHRRGPLVVAHHAFGFGGSGASTGPPAFFQAPKPPRMCATGFSPICWAACAASAERKPPAQKKTKRLSSANFGL